MKTFLIMNPRSHGGRSGKKFSLIHQMLEKEGMDYDFAVASGYQEMKALSAEANRKGYQSIVAVGGDGTINAVLNGFYDREGGCLSKAAMAVIYTGTSPDFCKSYGIPLDTEAAVRLLKEGYVRRIRTMRIAFLSGDKSGVEVRYYACCANIGLGARVARDANRVRKHLGDTVGTLVSLVRAVATYKSRRLEFTLDGKKTELNDIINLSAGRTRYIASGIHVAGGMADDDPRCYFLIAGKPGLLQLPSMLRQAYTGNIREEGMLSLCYGSTAVVSSLVETEVEFDGDPAGFLPCEISIAGDALPLVTGSGE